MKFSTILFGTALLFLLSGCVSEKIPTRMALGVPDGKIDYPPIPSEGLKLKMITSPILFAGEEANLNFSLSNDSEKEVQIPEWFSREADNIQLFIQPRLTEMEVPDPNAWTDLFQPPQQPVLHYPLVLMPGNKVIVGKKLSFVEKMQITPGHERRFYLKAKLTLKSLDLSTPVMELRVLPARNLTE